MGGDVASGDEGRSGRRIGGWLEKVVDLSDGMDDVVAGHTGPFCNEVWDIHPP